MTEDSCVILQNDARVRYDGALCDMWPLTIERLDEAYQDHLVGFGQHGALFQ